MKTKVLALAMTCVMLLGVMALAIPTSANAAIDVRYDLDQYGYQDYYTGAKVTTAPAQNGVVAANEYSLVIESAKYDVKTNPTQHDLVEYYAWDDTYLYYAAEIKNYGSATNAVYARIFTTPSPLAGPSWFNAIQVGVTCTSGNWSVTMDGGRNNEREHYDKVSSTGRFADAAHFSGSAKVTDGTLVFEYKIDLMELTKTHCPGGSANTATTPYTNYRFTLSVKDTYCGNILSGDALAAVKAADPNFNGTTIGKSISLGVAPAASETTPAPAVTDAPATAATTKAAKTTKAPATTAAPTEAPEVTEAPATTEAAKSGCGGTLTVSALAILPIIAGGVVIARKKED